MSVVRLQAVEVDLGRTPVLTGVDLVIEAGEHVGIAGPNGAGKTTLLSVLATLRAPSRGGGEILGARLDTDEIYAVRTRIGWSGHEAALYDELTLRENLRHFCRLGGFGDTAADDALEQVGLARAADRLARSCSNGMRRRADLARLLVTRPSLLLLDEAQAGLDADAAVIVQALAARTLSAGGAVVAVSHDHAALEARTHRVLDLAAGELG
ncbi:MAG TPA: heme ABC exporter ATP-binding protein CcmA [Acidimicrobiia bacterium]|nr:heme ABC exporter ATP-binding protein CcmA [Acidimicrobiia bacterium]